MIVFGLGMRYTRRSASIYALVIQDAEFDDWKEIESSIEGPRTIDAVWKRSKMLEHCSASVFLVEQGFL